MKNTPWEDCKVAFSVDTETDNDDLFPAIENAKWPEGWEFIEVDGSGSRLVLIFRVTGPLTENDGKRTKRGLKRIVEQLRASTG